MNNVEGKQPHSPKVSIIIPAFNSSGFIVETLESIFAQTYTDYEIIIVNDGSNDTDKLEELVAPYFEEITYIKQENKGVSAARNRAIRNAKGEYLAFLDSDDVWLPTYLESQLQAIFQKKCDLIYADAYLFGDGIKDGARYSDKAPSLGQVTTESLLLGKCCPILSGTVVSKKKVLENGMFDINLPWLGMEDFDLWFRLAKNDVKLDYQTNVLLKYRLHANSISGDRLNISKRTIAACKHIKRTYNLSKSEKLAADESISYSEVEILTEKAKLFMIHRNFHEALRHCKMANEKSKSIKLSAVIMLMKLSPSLLLFVLKILQPKEYKAILANRK